MESELDSLNVIVVFKDCLKTPELTNAVNWMSRNNCYVQNIYAVEAILTDFKQVLRFTFM